MSDQEVTAGRARAEDPPGIAGSSPRPIAGSRPCADDGGPRDPGPDRPRRHGRAAFTAALEDPSRLLLAALYGGDVAGYLSGPSASRRGTRSRCTPR